MKIKRSGVIFGFLCLFLVILFVMLYLTFMANFSANGVMAKPVASHTVIVDAGHGGEDGGAVGIDGTIEKNINLDIALKLEKILKFYGFNVIMTRTEDVMTCDEGLSSMREKKVSDIHNRFKLIEQNPEAIFVSVHQNKFSDSAQHGMQVFYSDNNEQSIVLAKSIQNSVVKTLQADNMRAVKKSGSSIYLLYHAEIPAVLAECGFISNGDEVKLLNNDGYRMKIAILIADGILKYFMNG